MANKDMTYDFPLGGLSKKMSHRNQQPGTTPDCLNVMPIDVIEGRVRGGSRPGLERTFAQQLGDGNPVRMISRVTTAPQDGFTWTEDEFDQDSIDTLWDAASWLEGAPELSAVGESISYISSGGLTRSIPSDADLTSAWVFEIYVSPYADEHHGKYWIFLKLNDTTPDAEADGLTIELDFSDPGGIFSAYARAVDGGSETTTTLADTVDEGEAASGWFTVIIDGSTLYAYWRHRELTTSYSIPTFSGGGDTVGFGMSCTNTDGGKCIVDVARLQYKRSFAMSDQLRQFTVVSADGKIYQDTWLNRVDEVSVTGELSDLATIDSQEYLQKLYIADYDGGIVDEDSVVVAADGVTLSKSGFDWTTQGISADDHVVTISNGTGSVTDGVYAISSVGSNLVLSSSVGGSGLASVRIDRTIRVYDPLAKTLTNLTAAAGKGTVQPGCPLLCIYRERLVIGAPPTAPHAYFMARQGDPEDWDYSQSDTGAAVAGTPANDGSVGQPLTALIPFKDDYLILGCSQSIWVLRGDPTSGGELDNVAIAKGIISRGAWCRSPGNEIIFLSNGGVYYLQPGQTMDPVPLTEGKMPRDLLGIDPASTEISMSFDFQRNGVHLFLTPKLEGVAKHYWIDWSAKSIWPMQYSPAHEPFCTMDFVKNGSVLFGCRDGYVRSFRNILAKDDGDTKDSYVMFGPMRLNGGESLEGVLSDLAASIPSTSGPITWEVLVSDSMEKLLAADVFVSGTWDRNGWQYSSRPRARGRCFALRLRGASVENWMVESVSIVIEAAGRARVF